MNSGWISDNTCGSENCVIIGSVIGSTSMAFTWLGPNELSRKYFVHRGSNVWKGIKGCYAQLSAGNHFPNNFSIIRLIQQEILFVRSPLLAITLLHISHSPYYGGTALSCAKWVITLSEWTNLVKTMMSLFQIPQCTIQNGNVHISVLNGALLDMEQVHCGICELALLGW